MIGALRERNTKYGWYIKYRIIILLYMSSVWSFFFGTYVLLALQEVSINTTATYMFQTHLLDKNKE